MRIWQPREREKEREGIAWRKRRTEWMSEQNKLWIMYFWKSSLRPTFFTSVFNYATCFHVHHFTFVVVVFFFFLSLLLVYYQNTHTRNSLTGTQRMHHPHSTHTHVVRIYDAMWKTYLWETILFLTQTNLADFDCFRERERKFHKTFERTTTVYDCAQLNFKTEKLRKTTTTENTNQ